MTGNPLPYRWQDHVLTPERSAMNLMVTALIVLAVGAAVMFSVVCSATPTPGAQAATERTPPLVQLAKRPVLPHATGTWP
jgi:hypothetical protein